MILNPPGISLFAFPHSLDFEDDQKLSVSVHQAFPGITLSAASKSIIAARSNPVRDP